MTAPGRALPGNGNGAGPPGSALAGMSATAQPALPTPGPVPLTFQIGQAQTPDGKTWAVLICYSAEGVRHMFLDPPTAKTIGNELVRLADAGPLILPPANPLLGS